MSGGHFNYSQYRIQDIIEELESAIKRCDPLFADEYDYPYEFNDATVLEFKKGLEILKNAFVYSQRIDWLLSGDDSEESFHQRLKEELNLIKKETK